MESDNVKWRKKRHYIYLAGNISADERTYEWREQFGDMMSDEPNVVIIDPCKNKWNKSMRGKKNTGVQYAKKALKKTGKILRPKDYNMVKIASIMVVNLELVAKDKPMIGTVQELAWANDIFYIPVIAITGKKPNIYNVHPWIEECCSAKVETVEEAVELIKLLFLEF